MDKDFMLNYFNKAVQPEWEELLKHRATNRQQVSVTQSNGSSFGC